MIPDFVTSSGELLADVEPLSVPAINVTALTTLTPQVAVKLPSVVVTVIVALPSATPVTMPSATVATLVLLDDQVTALFSALAGATVAMSVSVSPIPMVAAFLFSVTPVTAIGANVAST